MIEDAERLKKLFADASVTPWPKRPGIRASDAHEQIGMIVAEFSRAVTSGQSGLQSEG